MTPGELQWLSCHLGHSVATHKSNYRLHPNSIEISKVGRLLMKIHDDINGNDMTANNTGNCFKFISSNMWLLARILQIQYCNVQYHVIFITPLWVVIDTKMP